MCWAGYSCVLARWDRTDCGEGFSRQDLCFRFLPTAMMKPSIQSPKAQGTTTHSSSLHALEGCVCSAGKTLEGNNMCIPQHISLKGGRGGKGQERGQGREALGGMARLLLPTTEAIPPLTLALPPLWKAKRLQTLGLRLGLYSRQLTCFPAFVRFYSAPPNPVLIRHDRQAALHSSGPRTPIHL